MNNLKATQNINSSRISSSDWTFRYKNNDFKGKIKRFKSSLISTQPLLKNAVPWGRKLRTRLYYATAIFLPHLLRGNLITSTFLNLLFV